MGLLEKLLGTDKLSPTGKNKLNNIVQLLWNGYPGQVLVSQGTGNEDPEWQDVPNPFYADTAGNADTSDVATLAESLKSGAYTIFQKVLPIGIWNMDANATVTIASGISDATKVINVSVLIRNDDATLIYNLLHASTGVECDGLYWAEANSIVLSRRTGGVFDGTDYNDRVISRGWVTIQYIL